MSSSDAPEEKPKRRRRRKAAGTSEAASAPEGTVSNTPESEAAPEVTAQVGSELDPSAADVQAEEAAADVVLEADAQAEDEPATVDEPPADEEEPGETAAAGASSASRRATPARRRTRPQRDPSLPPPTVRARAKYVRSSARKARLVCDHIRGKTVEEARAILAHTPRAIARDWSKLLESAVANAEHNHELVGEDLVITAVHADEGPTIKRFRPRAMGRATRIRKRTSHLTILLTPKE